MTKAEKEVRLIWVAIIAMFVALVMSCAPEAEACTTIDSEEQIISTCTVC